jgi:DNA-binding PadR family transcriptional regulator
MEDGGWSQYVESGHMRASFVQTPIQGDAMFRGVLHGLAKVLVLHMASKGPVYGWALRKSLDAVGYRISSGTLYPLMRSLEANDLVRSTARPVGKRKVRYYELTAEGRLRLAVLRRELLRLVRDIGLDAEPARTAPLVAQSRRRSHMTGGRPAPR